MDANVLLKREKWQFFPRRIEHPNRGAVKAEY